MRTRLIQAGTAAGTRVETNRARPVWEEDGPALIIYGRTESSVVLEEAPRRYLRTYRLSIELFLTERLAARIDDDLDDFSTQVETVLLSDITLGGEAENIRLAETEIETDAEGRKLAGDARVTFEIDYVFEPPTIAPADIGDFLRLHAEWDLRPGTNVTREAVDDIALS